MTLASAFRMLALPIFAALLCLPADGQDREELLRLEEDVERLFARSCARAGCHAGPVPQQGMDLSPGRFLEALIGAPSRQRPDLQRVHPGMPDSSYLMMKLRGAPGIEGLPMPMIGGALTEEEIGTIEEWITGLTMADIGRVAAGGDPERYPFDGWKVMNLPTSRTLDAGSWLFLISHRFNPRVQDGYEAFYGLDGSGIIYLSMGYAVADALLVAIARSNADDNVELQVRQRLARQSQRTPVGAALQVGVNWITERVNDESAFRADVVKPYLQLSVTRELGQDAGLAVVPGILLNPDHRGTGETALLTVGLGGRWRFWRNVSLVGEWVPIVSGYTPTTTFGNVNRFDSWGAGIEITTGGHVFQIVGTNSVGLATDHYMNGGDLDIRSGDVRLGFNIFRILNF